MNIIKSINGKIDLGKTIGNMIDIKLDDSSDAISIKCQSLHEVILQHSTYENIDGISKDLSLAKRLASYGLSIPLINFYDDRLLIVELNNKSELITLLNYNVLDKKQYYILKVKKYKGLLHAKLIDIIKINNSYCIIYRVKCQGC